MTRPKKFYRSKLRGTRVEGGVVPYIIPVTPEFHAEWMEMVKQGGYTYPEDPIEIYLDNYLKAHRNKAYQQGRLDDKIEMTVRVRGYNVATLIRLAKNKRKPVEAVIREIMHKFKDRQVRNGQFFNMLEEYNNNKENKENEKI